MANIIPRIGTKPLLQRAWHKVYRKFYETPRRNALKEKLLSLPKSKVANPELDFTLHMMVCKRDLKMAICSALSFNLMCNQAFRWVFHDDGSLNDIEEREIVAHLPGVKVLRREEADTFAEKELVDYPEILKYRRQQIMALKIVDVRIWGKGEKFGYVDSDVLFFRRPTFFLDALANKNTKNYFNKDMQNAYVQSPEQIESFLGIRPFEKGNAGLWVMHREDINLHQIEEWLKHRGFSKNLYNYTLDQTFINLLANNSSHGVAHLPATYDVSFHKKVEKSINKHYVGAIRHAYELEGLRYLLEECDFENRWRTFVSESTK